MAGGFFFLCFLAAYLACFSELSALTHLCSSAAMGLLGWHWWYKFRDANRRSKKLLLISATVGMGLGLSYGFWQGSLHSETYSVRKQTIKLAGSVYKHSARSFILKTEKRKFRITGLTRGQLKKIKTVNTVSLSCSPSSLPAKSLFNHLERLQGIVAYCRLQKISGTESGRLSKLRNSIVNHVEDSLQQLSPSSLAKGFLLADTSTLPPAELFLYRRMGIAHLFAASGLHLGLVFSFFFLPFYWLRRPQLGRIVGLLAALSFLVLLDFRISLVRAFLFLLLYLLNKWYDHRTHPGNILFLTAIIIELLWPGSSFSLSFILSFSITGAIILFYGFFYRIYIFKFEPLRAHLALTLTTGLAALPLSLLFFGYSNPMSLLFNFLLVPLSSIYLALTMLLPFTSLAAYPLGALDFLFNQAARLFALWHFTFPRLHELFTGLWLVSLLGCSSIAFYYFVKKQILRARRFFPRLLPLLLLLFFSQFIFIPQSQNGIRAFVYGAQIIENGHYQIRGEPAPFIKSETILGQWPDSRIKTLEAPAMAELSHWRNFVTEQKQNLSHICVLHLGQIKPAGWARNHLAHCKIVYLAHGRSYQKQVKDQLAQWQTMFKSFSYDGPVIPLTYYRWLKQD